MKNSVWQIIKEEISGTFAFIQDLDHQATALLEDALELLWQDLRSFFSSLVDRP